MAQRTVAIVALTHQGVRLALRIQAGLPGSVCFVPMRHRFALALGARGFQRLADAVQHIWGEFRALICIMATGIVVRHIAPLLTHKASDPAVVVADELGRYAVSLLSGHLGGANALAREVAAIIGGEAVITTASDVEGEPAIDLLAREAALGVENKDMLSRVARALLEKERLWIYDPERLIRGPLAGKRSIRWLPDPAPTPGAGEAIAPRGAAAWEPPAREDEAAVPGGEVLGVWVSEHAPSPGVAWLLLRPPVLAVGIGCNRGTAAQEIVHFLVDVFRRQGLSPLSIHTLASIDLKADEAGLLEAAARLAKPLRFFSREQIARVKVPNPSPIVAKHIGVTSVCEAAALLSVQEQSVSALLVPKQSTSNVTLAVARGRSLS
jgi:cobalt-precorrin 5A hydrolase